MNNPPIKKSVEFNEEDNQYINDNNIIETDRFTAFFNSIIINYKSWVLFAISIYYLSYPNLLNGIITFIFLLVFAHLFHYGSHFECNYPINLTHSYHHNHHNFLSQFGQIMLEIFTGYIIILYKYFFDVPYLDYWIIIYFTIVYNVIHNFNYSVLRVNKTHEIHHKNNLTNVGPDIIDIIFGTKFNNNDLENTDHYIIAIVVATVVVSIIKYFWKKDNKIMINIFLLSFAAVSGFNVAFILYLFINDWIKYDFSFDYMIKFYKRQWIEHKTQLSFHLIYFMLLIGFILYSIYNSFFNIDAPESGLHNMFNKLRDLYKELMESELESEVISV